MVYLDDGRALNNGFMCPNGEYYLAYCLPHTCATEVTNNNSFLVNNAFRKILNAEVPCINDSGCDDGIACTTNTCLNNTCMPVPEEVGCTPSPTSSKPTSKPTTSKPTSSPTTSKPTSSPTVFAPCNGNQMKVEVKVLTDNYPGETSWKLTNQCNSSQVNETSGVPYTQSSTLYRFTKCLPTGSYVYTIMDTYGDGICCGFGTGSYEVLVDGNSTLTGGLFAFSETKTFGTTCVSPTIP
jgi:hypothetical protein